MPEVIQVRDVLGWPEFSPGADAAESPVPVTRVESWEHFASILAEPFFNRSNVELVFRGQKRHAWGLSPSLARLDDNKVIDVRTATRQLTFFRQAVRGRMSDMALVDESEADELWSVGQHHGLLTPVLDWTASPFVALFFAFEHEDREEDSPFRAVYVMNKTYLADKTLAAELARKEQGNPEISTPVRIYEPRKDDYGRLVNQAGLFTIANYGSTFENAFIESLQQDVLEDIDEGMQTSVIKDHLCKILIPNRGRIDCLRSLFRMNVHHASLFPDLEGAAKYCNGRVSDWYALQNPPTPEPAPVVANAGQTQVAETIAAPVDTSEPMERHGVSDQEAVHPALPLDPEFFAPPGLEEIIRTNLPTPELGIEQMQGIIGAISMAIRERQVPDWYIREPILASMRNAVRRILRQEGVGTSYAEKITEASVAVAATVAEAEAIEEQKKQRQAEERARGDGA